MFYRVTPEHAGQLLLRRGWKYIGPTSEADLEAESKEMNDDVYWWRDPEAPKGTSSCLSLGNAISEEFKRHLVRQTFPTRMDHIGAGLESDD
jgi:hypothetical protein